MPYTNIEQRKKFHREYMREYNKSHEKTEEQKAKKALYNKEYRLKNLKKLREYDKEYSLKNKDKIVSRKKNHYINNKEKVSEIKQKSYRKYSEKVKAKQKVYYQENKDSIRKYKNVYSKTIHGKYLVYKTSAKRRKHSFELEELIFQELMLGECHYCNLERAYGIDRKDSSVGYVVSNCVSCCAECNYMKRDIPYEKFLNKIKTIYFNKY